MINLNLRASTEAAAAPAAADPLSLGLAQGFRLTVMQVLPSLHTGGVERGTVDVAAAVVRAGGRAVVVSAGGPLVRELERAGAAHVTLPVDSKNPLVLRKNATALATVIQAHGVDIVHARSRAPAWSARAAARRTARAFVTTFHGTYNANLPFKKIYNAIMTKGDRVIAISEFIAEHMRTRYRVPAERIAVIHRGVDTVLFDPVTVPAARIVQLAHEWRLPDGVPVVLLPGRLTRWKGQNVFLDALARLPDLDFMGVIVGADQGREAYRDELERKIERLNLHTKVRLVDHCRDMPAAYKLADVVVSASTDPEAFGRVIAEAQAMGRPIVATDHGASREIVLPGETGWLVPPGRDKELADALRHAISLPAADRQQLAEAAVRHARTHFTKDLMCDRTLAVYREVMRLRRTVARHP